MIQQWRDEWKQPDLPFLFVQLANFRANINPEKEDVWPTLRASQEAALQLPKTGQAVTIDIGNPIDIHPRNKQEVGRRLALGARVLAYGEMIPFESPRILAAHKNGSSVILNFAGTYSKLKTSDEMMPKGFSIAGADGISHPALAVINRDRIIVSSPNVTAPVTVQYAWSDNPEDANVVNGEGLPMSPFSVGVK